MVPKLRFKDENGRAFQPPKSLTLGELAKFRRGSFPQPYGLAKWYDHINGAPFVQVFDVADDFKLKTNTQRYISKAAQEQSVFVKEGSLIITIQGSIGRVAITQYDAYLDRTLLLFESFKEDIDVNYFSQILYLLFDIERRKAPGGIIKTITKEVLTQFKIAICPFPEQQKIANFLAAVDTKISQLTKKLELLTLYKKGVMQKIFSQELRFKDDEEREFPEWEYKSISEVLTIGSGRDYKHLGPGSIPVYGTGGFMLSVDDFLYDGVSVCIGRKGTIDKPVLLSGKFWTVDTLFYTHSFIKCTPEFIYACFQMINWKQYCEASGVPSLSKSTIEKIEINLPCLKEQTKIASFLTAIDDKITNVKSQLEAAKGYKQGLLQQMFV